MHGVTFDWAKTFHSLKLFSLCSNQLSPPTTKLTTEVYETAATVKQLAPYTKYVFAVKAVNDHAKSSYSNNVTLTTKEDSK